MPGYTDQVVAWAVCNASAGAITTQREVGCVMARTAQGVYTMTLQEALDANDGGIDVELRTAGGNVVTVVHTSDTVKTATVLTNAGAAVDVDFRMVARRHSGGAGR